MTYKRIISTKYLDVKAAGPPTKPLEFPNPNVGRGVKLPMMVYDPNQDTILAEQSILFSPHSPLERGYAFRDKIARSTYGIVRLCIVVKRRTSFCHETEKCEWEFTDEMVAIKISSWARISQLRGQNLEDPLKEVSAMQLIGDYHPNVIGAIEVLQDDQYLYTIMPHCSGGDLFSNLSCDESHTIDEERARIWFLQLLDALLHLQLKGVCHRDLSLENLMIDSEGNLTLIDLGMALRVPYTDPCNIGYVTDVSEGTERRLIRAQGQGGKLMYMAPEIISGEEVFDGYAMDLWAAGVILFVLLIGMAPFKWAHESDTRYAKIAKGELKELLEGHKISISKEACDLLQHMFWQDPRKRLTLAQISKHPWIHRKRSASSSKSEKSAIVHSKNGLDAIAAS